MKIILIAGLAMFFGMTSISFTPGLLVKGRVIDEAGAPVAGAKVTETKSMLSVFTDASGCFNKKFIAQVPVLVITKAGYRQKTVQVNGKNLQIIRLVKEKLTKHILSGEYTDMKVANRRQFKTKGRQLKPSVSATNRNIEADRYEMIQAFDPPIFPEEPAYVEKDEVLRVKTESNVPMEVPSNSGDFNTEGYANITENRFVTVKQNALSTFSIDVDAASYSNVRRFLQMGQLPPEGAVHIEEMINYFHYNYIGPSDTGKHPFSIHTENGTCPWNPLHRLISIGLQGRKIPVENLPASNIVFLIDVSGSMQEPNKLPLVKASLKLLVEQLRAQDRISMVTYAGNAGLVLPATSGAQKSVIMHAIERLEAGGSTAGGEGIKLAYKTAKENFLTNGNNRIILCTDGDFNVGPSSDDELVRLIEEKRRTGVFLTVLGYGMGNYKDDKMEQLADKGNGNHAYIDGLNEAKKVLVNEFGATLFTIAKDVKLQVEFNPAKVQAYRLIGYENRMLNKEDFNNDIKDAGELGSGHTVTALYEIIPVGVINEFEEKVDNLKYQQTNATSAYNGDELLTVKFRYKELGGDTSKLIVHPVVGNPLELSGTSSDFRFAAAVAEFGLLLRNSAFKQSSSYDNVWELANATHGSDQDGYRQEFLDLVKQARKITSDKQQKVK